jgi:6-pyruvoyl-tetrahydropterin synthase
VRLYLGRFYTVNLTKRNAWRICVFVESRSGKLNPQTGMVIPIEELDDLVNDVLDKLRDKDISDIRELKHIPQTLEMYASRIWEMLEDVLPPYVRLVKVRLYEGKDSFIDYSGLRDGQTKRGVTA